MVGEPKMVQGVAAALTRRLVRSGVKAGRRAFWRGAGPSATGVWCRGRSVRGCARHRGLVGRLQAGTA